jgi:hypothetical protein
LIAGNQIGTNEGQDAVLGNTIGVSLSGNPSGTSENVVIGGTDPSFANLISGNETGIGFPRDNGFMSGVVVKGNLIGVQPNTSAPQVNQRTGIALYGSDNVIGGLEAGAGNVIAYNDTGIHVFPTLSVNNRILSNRIYANQTIGIDLDQRTYDNGTEVSNALGPTPNDPGDADTGGNNLQNFPVITDVQSDTAEHHARREPEQHAERRFHARVLLLQSGAARAWDDNRSYRRRGECAIQLQVSPLPDATRAEGELLQRNRH